MCISQLPSKSTNCFVYTAKAQAEQTQPLIPLFAVMTEISNNSLKKTPSLFFYTSFCAMFEYKVFSFIFWHLNRKALTVDTNNKT